MKSAIFNAGFYLCLASFSLISSVQSQSNILGISQKNPFSLTVCMEADTFELLIQNNSNTYTASNVNIELGFPSTGIYWAGFVGATSGSITVTDTLRSHPKFNIPQLLPKQSITIRYTARANCHVLADLGTTAMINAANVTYDVAGFGSQSQPLTTGASYNVINANLSIMSTMVNPAAFLNAAIGNQYYYLTTANRFFEVINTGSGAIDEVVIRITPEPEIVYNSFTDEFGIYNFPAIYDSNGDVVITLSGADLVNLGAITGSDPNKFEQFEVLKLYEDFTVVSCSEGNNLTSYEAQWGCDGQICQTGNNYYTNSNVLVSGGNPTVKQTIGNPNGITNYCRDGDLLTFSFTNTASGFSNFATDMVMDIISTSNYNPRGFSLYDFTLNGQLLNPGIVTQVSNIQWIGFASDAGHITPGYVIDLSNNTDASLAPDLDLDGFNDDLGAGKTFTITAKIRFDNPQPFEEQCPINYYAMFGLPQSHYKASCSDSLLESLDYSKGQFYNANMFPNSLANLITAPTDMIENQNEKFTFCTGSWSNPSSMDFFDCPVDSHYVVIHVPDGYYPVGNNVTFSSIAGDSYALTSTFNGTDLTISGGAQSFIVGQEKTWNGCYDLTLALSCDSSDNGTIPNESIISWTLNYLCDTCNTVQTRACSSYRIFNHADCSDGNLTCDGIVTSGFDVNRNSFGWTDYSQSTRVKATDPGINLDAAYTYDTIQTITSGRVKATNFNRLFSEMKYEANDTLMKWTNGSITVFDDSGNLLSTCPITTAPNLVISGTLFTYLFTMPLACMGTIDSNYQLQLVNNWEILNSNVIMTNKVYDIPVFRSNFNFERNDTIFKCDEWGAKFSLYNYGSFPFVYADEINKCDPLKIVMFVKNYGGSSGDDFPNEIRHLFRLDRRMVAYIPPGYSYVNDSAFTYQVIDASNPLNPITTLIKLTPIFQDADSVVFDYPWPILDKYEQSGSVKIYPPIIQFQLKPECDRENVTDGYLNYGYTNYDYASNTAYHTHTQAGLSGTPSQKYTIINAAPRISVNTGAYIVDAYTNKVKWQVRICNQVGGNQSVVGEAQNLWLDIDNVSTNAGNIQIDRVYVSANNTQSVINYPEGDDINSMVELGNLAANTCQIYNLEGSFVNCSSAVDSLIMRTAWSCNGYPVPEEANTAQCYVSENILVVRHKTADMNMVVTEPTGTFAVCDTISYLIELQSTGVGMMYDIDFWTNVPNGAQIINPEYLYTLRSGIWKSLPNPTNSFVGTNPIGWHLSQILNEWSTYGGGFYGSQRPDSSKIQLRFDLALNCDFNPNDSIVFNAFGITNCNDTITRPSVKRILIDGFTALDQLEVSVTLPDTLQCNETGRIDLMVRNLSTSPNQFQDSLKIEIPVILGVLNALPFGAVIQSDATNTTVKWKIPPASIAAGDSSVYSVFVIGSTVSACTTLELPSTVYYVGSSQCGLTVCTPTAIIDEADSSIMLCCNPCLVNAEFKADTVCYSTCCGGADTTCFRLLDQTTVGADYVHLWDFGDGFNTTDVEPCHIYDTVGVYYACHTVTQISSGCFATFCDSVRVIDKPRGAIELLGCNPFCEGDTVRLTVNGTYTSIEWVMLPSGTIVGTDDTLTVTQAGRYNAILSNEICTSECLAIDIHTQTSPDINIPDTAFCLGDSIHICAGGGFTSYEWQLNGTVINTVDSCIWIKTVGQYIVTVGQKLSVGCCTCEGLDTFTVIINTIDVTVPDLTICEDASGTICATPSGAYPPYTHSWLPNGETSDCITVSTAGDYIATVVDGMGCTSSDTGTVTIQLIPNADFDFDDTICLNSEYCYVPVNTGTHYWKIENLTGSIIATYNSSVFCFKFPEAGRYKVTHILTNTCGSDTVSHFVEVVPPVEACIVLNGNNPFCIGDTVCLTTNDPFNRVIQVEWYLNDVLVFVGASLCVTEPGTYRAKVTDNNGCTSECMCIVLSQNPKPIVDLPTTVTFCSNGTYTLDAGSGFEQYLWYRNGLPFAFGTSSILVTTVGMYKVEVSDANGCTAMDSTNVSALSLFKINSTDIMVCSGENFVLSTTYNANYSYQWFSRSLNSGNKNPWKSIGAGSSSKLSLNYTDLSTNSAQTQFRVLITDNTTGCVFEAWIMINSNSCLQMLIYPNPITDKYVTINYDLIGSGYTNAIFEFRNLLGLVVATYNVDVSLQEATLDVGELANGSYRISLIADGKTIDIKQVLIAH